MISNEGWALFNEGGLGIAINDNSIVTNNLSLQIDSRQLHYANTVLYSSLFIIIPERINSNQRSSSLRWLQLG